MKKCEPDGLQYLSNPPQSKCKNCGKYWVNERGTPECRITEMNTIYPMNTPKREWERTIKPIQQKVFKIMEAADKGYDRIYGKLGAELIRDVEALTHKEIEKERASAVREAIEEFRKVVDAEDYEWDGGKKAWDKHCSLLKDTPNTNI